MKRTGTLRVALVHDYLNQMGGAEKVLLALHRMFPDAPVYTTIAAPDRLPPAFRGMDIRPSFMQHLPGVLSHHQMYLPFYPLAVEGMNLRDYDLVLSDSSAFAKAAIKRKGAVHVCYCHTPMRWVWNYEGYVAREGFPASVRAALPPIISRLRRWDVATAARVDRFIANSSAVAQRIRQSYHRSAEVIPPPVEVGRFHIAPKQEGYFLVLSRLAPYKRIDLVVQACTALGLSLKVIGGGRDLARLQTLAGPSVQFLGALPDAETREVLARCRALIFPGEEDFGIAPVEAQACGRPVIAYGAGGALSTVIPGRTGLFFHEQTVDALMAALNLFRDGDFDPSIIRQHAEYFDVPHFVRRISHAILRAGIFLEPATIPLPSAA